jgi:predicted ribosomally synthesized peptide with nif11-like leader
VQPRSSSNEDNDKGDNVTQEDVIALLDRAAHDLDFRAQLRTASSADSLAAAAADYGFHVSPSGLRDALTDSELEGVGGSATDRTCYGTTDCCHTKRTCFGTTDCCR